MLKLHPFEERRAHLTAVANLPTGDTDTKEEKGRRILQLTEQAFQAVTDEYKQMLAAMADPAVRESSGGIYSQPWKQ